MGSCVWRTHDGSVRAQVHSPSSDLETTLLVVPTLRFQGRSAKGSTAWWLQSWARENTDGGHALEQHSERTNHTACRQDLCALCRAPRRPGC